MRENEQIQMAVMRKLQEETGITAARIDQIGIYSDICKDPRGWTVSIVHLIIPHTDQKNIRPGKTEADVRWFKTTELPQNIVVGFDDTIRSVAKQYREKL